MSEQETQKSAAPDDYESATARLDEIIARLDSGDAQLRETLDLCAEAKNLIEYCATELAAVDEGLRELRLEDLAASLQSGPSPAGSTGPGDLSRPDGGQSAAAPEQDHAPSLVHNPPPPEEPPF